MIFRDREEAGRLLAAQLDAFRGQRAVVLGLPRGGVPVAYEVARALALPLDVLVVRKLGAPDEPELGMGAVAEGGVRIVDPHIVAAVGATDDDVERIAARELREVERRVERWRGTTPARSLEGKVAIVVDDGIATGGTVRAALQALRRKKPTRIVLAVPVAPTSTLFSLRREADEIVCLEEVDMLWSIGAWYEDFAQVSDTRVTELLEQARTRRVEESAQRPSG